MSFTSKNEKTTMTWKKNASILYQVYNPGDGPSSTTEQLAAESELCKAEKQQRAEKRNQCNATPVPGNDHMTIVFEMWKKCGK